MKPTTLVAALSLTALVACTPPASQAPAEAPQPAPEPMAKPSADIAARAAAWIDAFNSGDVDAIVAFYTEDAWMLPPNAPMGQGHEAVRAPFEEMLGAGMNGTMESLEAMEAGDMGHNVGTFTLIVDGEEVDRGKFIELWRKVDGEWKITHDMFSSDLPLPE